ncbi:AtpZ/AtpI family protein [Gelidibacter mesophilus]|uniref:AtpZ/AtpI family protein n=1 Tax=Gelidibacter mesophilus TaxID=169050 RepID=UPI00040701FC|nr:AtpZ/AtpI family protein [Gelidibacter mesophilus]
MLPKKDNQFNSYAKYSGIAIQMFVIIGIGSFIGVKLDDYNENTNNLWTIVLSLTSTIIAIIFVIRRIIANSKDDN